MPLKVTEIEGVKYAVLSDAGVPLYTVGDTEVAYDGEELATKISSLNGEITKRRNEAKEAKEALAKFNGIEDPDAAIKAIATVKNLDDKKLVDAGEVEKVKTEAIKAVEEKYEPITKERDNLKASLHKEMIGGRFARSKFISEKMASPIPMVEATFGSHFSIEDGQVVARNQAGNEIFSPSNPGERADFDEALQVLVEASPFRDQIMLGTNKNGTGAPGSGDAGPSGKSMSRSEYESLAMKNPQEALKRVREGCSIVDVAV